MQYRSRFENYFQMGEKLITVAAYPIKNCNELPESQSKCSVDASM